MQLKRVHLVQFFLFQAQTLELDPTTAVIAPNGAGKSALLDALQIVMLGGDRNQIRFNAQAGGSHRARTLRDYCLGVYRSGDDGRARETATTYISLVFENTGDDAEAGAVLSAGIALGAAASEPEHRMHGLYLLPGVALSLDDHLEIVDGAELPLTWPAFRERIARRCKQVGTRAELHPTSDRFVRDLLVRLRPSPTAQLDPVAYRKAFQNSLNLQRINDVDLFVRTLVAEERPTEIARFRALLDGFRQIKEKVEQVARRIETAEAVDEQYRKIAGHATRAASYRALAAEYRRDAHGEAVEAAEDALDAAGRELKHTQRSLAQARSEHETALAQADEGQQQLQGLRGYGDQASFEQLSVAHRSQMQRCRNELLRGAGFVRDQLQIAGRLGLSEVAAETVETLLLPWQAMIEQIQEHADDADLELDPDQVHERLRETMEQARPIIASVRRHARDQQQAIDQALQRASAAKHNLARLQTGRSELRADVIRLFHYLRDEGIPARPVCDLVRVADPAWQAAIEAYLRSHVDALLIPAEHEERAVRLYRSLHGGRSVYGVKLAWSSHARRGSPAEPGPGQVAALLSGEDADALAYLRRQLGNLDCVDSDAEVVRSRQGLSRDGLIAKGGGVERLRLPAATELRIGASDQRERARQLRKDLEQAQAQAERLTLEGRALIQCADALARLDDAQALADTSHRLLLEHRQASALYRAQLRMQAEHSDPDLLRLSEQVRAWKAQADALRARMDALMRDEGAATSRLDETEQRLRALQARSEAIARDASQAFNQPDVDANRVEQLRTELDTQHEQLDERLERCTRRADEAERQLSSLLPAAWSALHQYAKDHGVALDMQPDEWRKASGLLRKQIDHLKGTELVQHQAAADQAYQTAVDTFRVNVASSLYDNFTRLQHQIHTLNRTLRQSPAFSNNERYQFRCEVVPELKDLHRFIARAAEIGESDTLFGSAGAVPAAFREIIEDGSAGKPSPLDDYRRFFHFEVLIKQDETVIGTLSERMRSGSGGEHRAPLYVIAGAALAAAYGKTDGQRSGLGVIMLDEFGDKIDAQNARATTDYLRSLGLQLILAAPDTAQGALTGVLDSYIELFRDGPLLHVERNVVTAAGRELLASDQFQLHPELLEREIARLTAATPDTTPEPAPTP